MAIANKKIEKAQIPVVKQIVTGIESIKKQLVAQDEEKLKTSELLLLQINSGENEILFI